MDTSGLSSSISLAAFLVGFGYLSLVQEAISLNASFIRTSDSVGRLLSTIGSLRIAAVVATVASVLALILGQGSPGVATIAGATLGLLAFLIITNIAAKYLSARYPILSSNLALPVYKPLLRLISLFPSGSTMSDDPNGELEPNLNGDSLDLLETAPVVITEREQAQLDPRERLMIRSILRLDESIAREVMVPRVDIVATEADSTLTDVASRMLESGHSRLPVYRDSIDNVIGVVHSRDLLPFLTNAEEHPSLEQIIRPAFFIPEAKRLDELLKELQEKRVHMSLVVDEYGGIEGLVTLEDLLEEIVGEIEDEFSGTLEPRVVPVANGEVIVDARVSLDYISDLFATTIGDDDVDTIGGLVYSALGKMPQVGDEILHDGLKVEVVSLLGRRLRKLKLSRTAS